MTSKTSKGGALSRMKTWFRSSNTSLDDAHARSAVSKEGLISERTFQNLCSESDLPLRLKTLKELEGIVAVKYVDDGIATVLWHCAADLFAADAATSTRAEAFRFLIALCKAQAQYLTTSRAVLFEFLKNHRVSEDLPYKIDLLKYLSQDGKDVGQFEEDVGLSMLDLLNDVLRFGHLTPFLNLLQNLIKFNAAFFDEATINSIVDQACIHSCCSQSAEEIDACLNLLDVIQCYSYLPASSLLTVVSCLCKLVNSEERCNICWRLMRKLLSSQLGHSAVYTLCNILQSADLYPDYTPIRGAVFFLGMSLWGSQRVSSLKHTPVSILPSLYDALNRCQSPIVVYEVALSIQRLVLKYGFELQLVTWDMIVLILEKLLQFTELHKLNSADRPLFCTIHDILSTMESYHEVNNFAGSTEQLFALVEYSAKNRPENSILRLLDYKAQNLNPVRPQWLETARRLMETYFVREARPNIRTKAISVARNLFTENRFLYAEEMIEQLILPLFAELESEKDAEVQQCVANFIIDIAKECTSNNFFDLVGILERVVNSKLELWNFAYVEDSLAYFGNVHMIIRGLLEILERKWNQSPTAQALFVFELLTTHVLIQYSRNEDCALLGADTRETIFAFLLRLKVNQKRQIGYAAHQTTLYSVYLHCFEPDEEISPPLSPTTSTPPSGPVKLQRLDFKQSLSVLSACLQHERAWPVLKLVLTQLPILLQNQILILRDRDEIGRLCTAAILLLKETEPRLVSFLRTPDNLLVSELNEIVYPLLSSLIAYKACLSELLQRKLVTAIQCGIVSHTSTPCVLSTIICIIELPEIFAPMAKDLIRRLADIKAVPGFAIALIELLTTLMRLPTTYSQFAEIDFIRLSHIILPLLNPFQFTPFIVASAYYTAMRWFLRCPIAYRPGIARLLVNGMNEIQVSGLAPDDPLRRLHEDTKSVCMEFFSLFLFNDELPPVYSDKSDFSQTFLISPKRARSWLQGNRLTTISTCAGETGPCERCTAKLTELLAKRKKSSAMIRSRASTGTTVGTETSEQVVPGAMSDLRKRHKSAFQKRPAALKTAPKCLDDSFVSTVVDPNAIASSSNDTLNLSVCDLSILNASFSDRPRGLSESAAAQDEEQREEAITLPLCNCWCSGWAQVKIRHAFGTFSWLLQIKDSKIVSTTTGDDAIAKLSLLNNLIISGVELVEPSASQTGRLSGDESAPGADKSSQQQVSPYSQLSSVALSPNADETNDPNDFIMNLDSELMFRSRAHTVSEIGRRASFLADTQLTLPIEGSRRSSQASSRQAFRDRSSTFCSRQSRDSSGLGDDSTDGQQQSRAGSVEPGLLEGGGSRAGLTSPGRRIEKSSNEMGGYTPAHSLPALAKSLNKAGLFANDNSKQLASRKTSTAKEFDLKPVNPLDPAQLFLQLFGQSVDQISAGPNRCIALPQANDVVERTIKLLDLMTSVETFKVGVVYVAPGQKAEAEILANQYGSVRYHAFLEGLGSPLSLKDVDQSNTFIGGLDTGTGRDGSFTYHWKDQITQVVFHVATLMPTLARDAQCAHKKRHLGNDFVCIVYNDSLEPFQLGTIKGQFAYVAIVVQPVDEDSLLVTLNTKDEISRWLAFKQVVISDAKAPLVCRQMAMRADTSARIWQSQQQNQDPSMSNVVERLKHIRRLREKQEMAAKNDGIGLQVTRTFLDYCS